ncbi:MAG: acyl-CoA dehydrogenase [Ramlibacter sp.]|nr:acyl-CoA dehydrogenase [Ramlibacter sp.]
MRDTLLDSEDKLFREEIQDFMARELGPRAQAIERDEWKATRDMLRELGRAGYLTPMFKDHYRGKLANPGLTHAVMVTEEAARLSYAFETTVATALSCAYPLHRHAQAQPRERWLDAILSGQGIGAICITEDSVGSDSAGMKTTLRYDESTREWVVNGFKRYISNASVADVYLVYGITDASVSAQKGMSAVLVPKDARGMSFPRRYSFMGRRGCVVGEVRFEDVRIPADHLLGEPNRGFQIMLGMFNFERVILGGSGLGVARSAFEIAIAHAQQREVFGEMLSAKQLTWDKIAEMSWRIDAAELLTYRAAKLYDRGTDNKTLMKPAAMAKLVATETANYCADRTVQILGGDGLTCEYGRAEQIYRDARALTIVGGTSEMVKYLIASADLPLAKPKL